MYRLIDYGKMMADPIRVEAYRAALAQVVEPGTTVLDVGTGAGLFALLACQLGASRVWAVEPEPVIALARELVRANGFTDRVELLAMPIERVELPRRVDVLVSDLRGVLPLVGRHLPILHDARTRLLAQEGKMVAERDTLWLALVEGGALRRRLTDPWHDDFHGLDLRAGHRLAVHGWLKPEGQMAPNAPLAPPACWFELDYRGFEEPHARGRVELEIARPGWAHGLALWFESELVPGITLENRPWEERRIYGHVFLALEEPVALRIGDRATVEIRADLVNEDYIWTWQTEIRRGGSVLASFRQSSFHAEPLESVPRPQGKD